MHRLTAASVVLAMGCSSFGTDTGGSGAAPPAAADAGDGAIAEDGGTGRGCPKPAPPNTKCWDFDDGVTPGGGMQLGSLSVDTSTFWSPGHSLLASTKDVPNGEQGWAHLEHVWAKPPVSLALDESMRLDEIKYAELMQFRIAGASGTAYELRILCDGGLLRFIELTIKDNNNDTYHELPVGSVTPGTWARVSVGLAFVDFPGPSARRKLTLSVDGEPRLDNEGSGGLERIAQPGQMTVETGITYVNGYSSAKPPQRMHLDDVMVSWTP